jgi:excisionase family DNA binding protein
MDVLPDPDLVSLEAAAVMLGIGVSTAYSLARRGQLPGAVKLGNRWRVSLIEYRRIMHGQVAS